MSDNRSRALSVARVDRQPAGAGQRDKPCAIELPPGPIDEFIDIPVVIGEQDIALKILGPGAGVMRQPRQAEIGAQSVEQRQRHRSIADIVFGIGDFVADRGEVGRGEMPRHILRPDHADARAERPVEHIGKRDFLARGMDGDHDIVIFEDQAQLRGQVIGKQRGPGYRGGVDAALGQAPECAAGRHIVGIIGQVDPQFGIGIRSVIAPAGGRHRAIGGKGGDIGAQCGDRAIVQAGQFGQVAAMIVSWLVMPNRYRPLVTGVGKPTLMGLTQTWNIAESPHPRPL